MPAKSLQGRSVLITRPRDRSGRLAELLRRRGAHVALTSAIRTVPPTSWTVLRRALKDFARFDILVFTSANAVEGFFSQAGKIPLGHIRTFAIGPATGAALKRQGVREVSIPQEHEGASLAKHMGRIRGCRILLPRAQKAPDVLPRALRAAGAEVTIAPCYRTVGDPVGIAKLRQAARKGSIDWITFTSGSTVDQFVRALTPAGAQACLRRARAASIGPITTLALRRHRLRTGVEASPYTAEGLVAAIEAKGRTESIAVLKSTLLRALRAAGGIALGHFGRVTPHFKGRANIVTEADLAAEQRILDIVLKKFPNHDFVTEERAPRHDGSDYTWIIDPIDGTNNFAHTYPVACVSIAVSYRGDTLLGGIYDPFRKELFLAEKKKGATLNGKRIRISRPRRLKDSLLITGFPYDKAKRSRFYLDICQQFLQRCHGLRRSGSAALDLAWIAAGRADGYWEFNLNPWDFAAGALIVREAGGRVSDFDGAGIADPLVASGRLLATNGEIHKDMIRILRGKK